MSRNSQIRRARWLIREAEFYDNFAMAHDGPVPATYEVMGDEMTRKWMREAYLLAQSVVEEKP